MKSLFLNLQYKFFKLFEYKKVNKNKLKLFLDHIDYYFIDYSKYREYLCKYSGTVIGKKDLKKNYYLQKAWYI